MDRPALRQVVGSSTMVAEGATDGRLWSRRVLWYSVDKTRLVTLVIVRDPDGACPDDFFVTDDDHASGADVASRYAGRWSIEICFREVKERLGAEDPQSWKGEGPERGAALSLWLYSAIWTWHISIFGAARTWTSRPWYAKKATPSFIDALASAHAPRRNQGPRTRQAGPV